MGLPWYALLAGGVVFGGVFGVWFIRNQNQAVADKMDANSAKNYAQAKIDADAAEDDARKAADAAKQAAADKATLSTDW